MTRLRGQNGTALVLAMTVTLLLAAAGAAAMLTARMETLLAGSFTYSQQALSVAEGGLARALQDLSPQADWTPVLSGAPSTFTDGSPSAARQLPGGDVVVICCGAASLTSELQLRGHGGRTWGSRTPQWRLYAWGSASNWVPRPGVSAAFYVVVWVADDVEDGDGDPGIDRNGVILVRALALGPGRARRAVQATIQHARDVDGLPLGRGVAVISSRETRW